MQQFYLAILAVFVSVAGLRAQTTVVPANLDGTEDFPYTILDVYIDKDTSATGEQLNDTYLLEAGGFYYFSKTNRWDFDITIGATGNVEELGRPLIDRINPAGTTELDAIYRGTGSFYWDNVYLILGDEGPNAAAYETASFRPEGIRTTYSWNNCIIEKSRQGTIRSEGDSISVFITNSILRNFGDYGLFQGNGRVVDLRTGYGDSVVISNNVIHNILDRIYIGFRQRGLNYFEFTNNTVFNHIGRHGFIQLKNTKEAVINDNFIQNPSIIGTAPFLADEQIQAAGEQNYLFSLDSIVTDASIEMLNNNIHWTDDVLEHYADFEPVDKPELFSPTFITALTNDTSEAYFSEVLELDDVPSRDPLIQYAEEAVTDQSATNLTNIMVEDSTFATGTDYDRGYLFDFNKFSPCYDPASTSATGATDGGAVGAAGFCADLNTSVAERAYNPFLRLRAAPNPARDEITFSYETAHTGAVQLDIFDLRGVRVRTLLNQSMPAGKHTFRFEDMQSLATGMYFGHVQTPEGRMYVKFFKQ